jgi:hypothetical protein
MAVGRNAMRYMTYDYKDPIRPMFWMPEAQTTHHDDPAYEAGEIWSHYLYNIVIWVPGNPPGIEEKVRKALVSVDPDFVLYGVDSHEKVVRGDFQQEDMIATLTTLFGALGLVLSAIGLYGVMAYMVEQRTGIPAAIGAGKLMTQQLFSVRPWDPIMLGIGHLDVRQRIDMNLDGYLMTGLPTEKSWSAASGIPLTEYSPEAILVVEALMPFGRSDVESGIYGRVWRMV